MTKPQFSLPTDKKKQLAMNNSSNLSVQAFHDSKFCYDNLVCICHIWYQSFLYYSHQRPPTHPGSVQLPQTGPSKNGKNLFLSRTQKIEKNFLIFFPT